MKADLVIKNAKIFTSDRNNPYATALAVKDGIFIYVGEESGISDYEAEVKDLDGCYVITQQSQVKEGIEQLKRFNREYNSEHLKVHTLKIFMDGTLKIETAALTRPYEDTRKPGVTSFNEKQIAKILIELNKEGFNLHLHTVGDDASRKVLDGVELARKELGDRFRVKVTCAHLEIQDDDDIDRFAKLGVFANYSPWWHAGNASGVPLDIW